MSNHSWSLAKNLLFSVHTWSHWVYPCMHCNSEMRLRSSSIRNLRPGCNWCSCIYATQGRNLACYSQLDKTTWVFSRLEKQKAFSQTSACFNQPSKRISLSESYQMKVELTVMQLSTRMCMTLCQMTRSTCRKLGQKLDAGSTSRTLVQQAQTTAMFSGQSC